MVWVLITLVYIPGPLAPGSWYLPEETFSSPQACFSRVTERLQAGFARTYHTTSICDPREPKP